MDTLSALALEIGTIGRRAKKLLTGNNVVYLLQEMGLQLDTATYNTTPYQNLRNVFITSTATVSSLVQAAEALETALSNPQFGPKDLVPLATAVYDALKSLYQQAAAIKAVMVQIQTGSTGINQQALQAFANEFIELFSQQLLIGHLQSFHERLLAVFTLLGIVDDRVSRPLTPDSLPDNDLALNLNAFSSLLRNPSDHLAMVYNWGTPNFAYRRFLLNLEQLLTGLGLPVYFDPPVYEVGSVPGLYFGQLIGIRPANDASYAFDVVFEDQAFARTFLLPTPLAGWEFEVSAALDLEADTFFRINWDGTIQATLQGPSAAIGLSVAMRLPQKASGAAYTLLGTPFGTGLTASAIELKAAFITPALQATGGTTAKGSMAFAATFTGLSLGVAPGETDSFLSKLLGGQQQSIKSDLTLEWTQVGGLAVRGAQGLLPKKTVNLNVGPLHIVNLTLGLDPQNDATRVVGTFSATADLGPVRVTTEDMGLAVRLSYAPGNLGPFGLAIGFQPPAGIGIAIASDAIKGGGYIYLDRAHHKYSGAAQLKFKDKLNLNALALLQTQLPNNQPGYSFLLLITAQFSPIQLGMGFTLNGVGGVIGINRHVDTTFLLGLVRNGSLDQLLFPANVMDNPTAALAVVDNSFPAIEDRFVFGLMAKIGWGTPTLITLDVALIIELPAPVRLVILGILKATLPDLDHPVLRLKAAFLGVIDFANQRISFDATLYDSGILMFTLSGDMAFRLYQGSNPVFVLTAGGFHPSFQPPANANLPALRRLTLSLADSSDFRLILTSYFAVTSNTVQFGSRLDLYVHLFSKCTLEGFLYFDALFHFNPFSLNIQIGGGVAIKWDGDDELSISLRLTVTGPGPWHVWGVAEFDLFCWSYTKSIDKTFGASASQPPLNDVNVRALLQAALTDVGNWEMQVPSFRASSPVVLRPAEAPPGKLLVDPNGTLTFHQRLVPLTYQLDLYGNAHPTQGNRFDIVSVDLGTQTLGPVGPASPYAGLVETRDYFSPGQFRQLNDGQKLSSASFQLMPNGFQLYGPQGYASGPAAIRGVEYELIVLAASTSGGSSVISAQRSSGTEPASETSNFMVVQPTGNDTLAPAGNARQVIASDTYQRLAKNSAIGRAYADEQQSYRAPNKFTWHDDEYTLVHSADLSPYLPGSQTFGSEAEATAFLNTEVSSNPQLLGELVVIPAYQFAL